MIFLLYTSQAQQPLDTNELREMLSTFRTKNVRIGVTGVLLYADNSFIQLLEGPRIAVLTLYDVIRRDARHQNVHLVVSAPINTRCFPSWSMGFLNGAVLSSEEHPAYTSLLESFETPSAFMHLPNLSRRLLLSFRDRVLQFSDQVETAQTEYEL